ncbi:hypothetical protein Tcan_03773 [Toxocara canis]|uniref:Uncharacterized protein n=1 Tax=Toxocara canis TaxID=6265 RepID=A0A0B2URQ5_TOXCA|nr:hypothetical protein Tcan_03773 [Toxocara canis]
METKEHAYRRSLDNYESTSGERLSIEVVIDVHYSSMMISMMDSFDGIEGPSIEECLVAMLSRKDPTKCRGAERTGVRFNDRTDTEESVLLVGEIPNRRERQKLAMRKTVLASIAVFIVVLSLCCVLFSIGYLLQTFLLFGSASNSAHATRKMSIEESIDSILRRHHFTRIYNINDTFELSFLWAANKHISKSKKIKEALHRVIAFT